MLAGRTSTFSWVPRREQLQQSAGAQDSAMTAARSRQQRPWWL